jgi:quercetin dioxygenase-like cupin family protein
MNHPFNLAEAIQYQEGSVVSKEILNKSTGTITLFAFDKGQGLSEHKTPFEALVYIIDGKAEIILSDTHHILKNGDAIVFPQNAIHALKAIEKFKMLLIMIRS